MATNPENFENDEATRKLKVEATLVDTTQSFQEQLKKNRVLGQQHFEENHALFGGQTNLLQFFQKQIDQKLKQMQTGPVGTSGNPLSGASASSATSALGRDIQALSEQIKLLNKNQTHYKQTMGPEQYNKVYGTGTAEAEAKRSQEEVSRKPSSSRPTESYAKQNRALETESLAGIASHNLTFGRLFHHPISGHLHTISAFAANKADRMRELSEEHEKLTEEGKPPANPISSEEHEAMGRTAQKLKTAALATGSIESVFDLNHIRESMGEYGKIRNWNMIGAQLGAPRGNGIFSGIPGIGPLFSSAGGEGAKQSIGTFWNALTSPGVNMEQAQMMRSATNEAGFGGSNANTIVTHLLTPLFQKTGVNPQIVIKEFEQQLRTGVTSIHNLTTALKDLDSVSKSTNRTVNQVTEELGALVKQTEAGGGSALRGIEFGNLFGSMSGLPVSQAQPSLENPLAKAYLGQISGEPPQLQSELPASTKLEAIYGSMERYKKIFGHMAPRRNAKGEIIESSEEEMIGMITNYSGLPRSTVEAELKQSHAAMHGGIQAVRGISNMEAKLRNPNFSESELQRLVNKHGILSPQALKAIELEGHHYGISAQQELEKGGHIVKGSVNPEKQTFEIERNGKIEKLHFSAFTPNFSENFGEGHLQKIHQMIEGPHFAKEFHDIEKNLEKSGMFSHKKWSKIKEELSGIQGEHAGIKKLHQLQADVGKHIEGLKNQEKPVLEVELAGDAKKAGLSPKAKLYNWQVMGHEYLANEGKAMPNETYASPLGPQPLIGSTEGAYTGATYTNGE